ncbi:hypothetical protein DPEC_G00362230 [Dallia pectoralis]|nr:hypothetical protein DPEC_G00362230 [Dallia pectoralis]
MGANTRTSWVGVVHLADNVTTSATVIGVVSRREALTSHAAVISVEVLFLTVLDDRDDKQADDAQVRKTSGGDTPEQMRHT